MVQYSICRLKLPLSIKHEQIWLLHNDFCYLFTAVYFANHSDQYEKHSKQVMINFHCFPQQKNHSLHFNNLSLPLPIFCNHSDHCTICAAIYSKQVMINFYPFPLQKKSHRLLQTIYHLNPNWQEGGHFPILVLFESDFVSWVFIKIFQSFL